VRRSDTVRLNTHFVVRRVEVLGLKQWWLARVIGVDRKTVNRWLTGKVKRINRYNAEKLAEYLECSLEEIIIPETAVVYATREEQRGAAELLRERDLLQILSPSDNWELAERLIKATMYPDLPLRELGRLYNLLSIAAWRQGNYAEATAHAERAMEIGERLGDRGIMHNAIYNVATVDSLLGRHSRSMDGYEECLVHPEYFDTKREHAKVLSNISMVYRDFVMFDKSFHSQVEAIRMFEGLGLPFNLAIAWAGMAVILTELGFFEEARASAGEALRYADETGFEKGTVTTPFCIADAVCLQGYLDEARPLVEGGLEGLKEYDVYDLACHEIAARFFRRAGEYEEAAYQLETGLGLAEDFPTLYAMMLQESARLANAKGVGAEEERLRLEANYMFEEMGLPARVRNGPVAEYGAMFSVDPDLSSAIKRFFTDRTS
jgi:tetratricopeptide (TPR) repeat protein